MNEGVMLSIRGAGAPIQVHIDRDVIVGRASTSDIWLPFDFVSARHLRVFGKDNVWFIEDLGSTNGTRTPKGPVVPHTPVPIGSKLELIIQDLNLVFSPSSPKVAAFTLALSGSIARQLVSDVASGSEPAFIEVISGPATGVRFEMADEMARVGLKLLGAEFVITDDAATFLSRDGEGFGIEHNGAPLHRLRNGERFEIDDVTCVFFDPLEAQLSPIPEVEPVESPDRQDTSESLPVPDKKIPLAALLVLAAVVGIAVLILGLFLI